jgi:hypothetical protein
MMEWNFQCVCRRLLRLQGETEAVCWAKAMRMGWIEHQGSLACSAECVAALRAQRRKSEADFRTLGFRWWRLKRRMLGWCGLAAVLLLGCAQSSSLAASPERTQGMWAWCWEHCQERRGGACREYNACGRELCAAYVDAPEPKRERRPAQQVPSTQLRSGSSIPASFGPRAGGDTAITTRVAGAGRASPDFE